MNKAVFLDKDGTLIQDVPYNADPKRIALCRGAVRGLDRLKRAGYRLIVVSNQSGVARGYFPEESLIAVERRVRELLAEHDLDLDGFYYCPHHPDGVVTEYAIQCECRKPSPGMLIGAARGQEIDLGRSWMVGDILNDVEAGARAGCETILVDNGNETEWKMSPMRRPHFVVRNLFQAAQIILSRDELANARRVPIARRFEPEYLVFGGWHDE